MYISRVVLFKSIDLNHLIKSMIFLIFLKAKIMIFLIFLIFFDYKSTFL